MLRIFWKIMRLGGWVLLLVFATHLFISGVLHAYQIWPPLDMPMHFCGGMSIAYFVSRCFQSLPRADVRRSGVVLLELLLIISLTATAAVFWEFAEFATDQLFRTNLQIGLADTMSDLAMGLLGAVVFTGIRARQLGAGMQELQEFAGDWARGGAASVISDQ